MCDIVCTVQLTLTVAVYLLYEKYQKKKTYWCMDILYVLNKLCITHLEPSESLIKNYCLGLLVEVNKLSLQTFLLH